MKDYVVASELSPLEVSERTREIYQKVLSESRTMDSGNFTRIHTKDVERLFHLYDAAFFDEKCRQQLGGRTLRFRLSKRMTSSGGSTSRFRTPADSRASRHERFEIAFATSLLFQTFHPGDRAVAICGIPCHDRLEALQRVMEHELVHLVEMLIWRSSKCSRGRFQSIARRFFGHTDHRHQLITPRERALTAFGVRAGQRVSFSFEGRQLVGRVNRITKRATVLVEDSNGQRYSDGKRYTKFYVAPRVLTVVPS